MKGQVLVTSYVNADLDGVASMVAYAEYLQKQGTDAVAGVLGAPQAESLYVLGRFNLEYPMTLADAHAYEQGVLVDASELIGLEGKVEPEKVVEIIDHRKNNDADKFPNAKIQIELVGAAATLVGEKFMQNNVPISQRSAILLEAAVISNTLNFKSGTTTDRDRVLKEWLNKETQLPADFWRDLFVAKSDMTGNKLRERLDADFAWFTLGGKNVGCAQIEMIGVDALMAERGSDILAELERLKTVNKLDTLFASFIELEKDFNLFIATDPQMREVLSKILGVTFDGNFAKRDGLIMRKQIAPLLRAELEK